MTATWCTSYGQRILPGVDGRGRIFRPIPPAGVQERASVILGMTVAATEAYNHRGEMPASVQRAAPRITFAISVRPTHFEASRIGGKDRVHFT